MASRVQTEGWYAGYTPATTYAERDSPHPACRVAPRKHVRSKRTCGAPPRSSAAYLEHRINQAQPGDPEYPMKQERWSTCDPAIRADALGMVPPSSESGNPDQRTTEPGHAL